VEHLYRKELLTNGKFNGKVQFNLQQLEKAAKDKKPQVIAIWNDLYHEALTVEQIGQTHRIMANKRNAHHTFLIVTKRADRAADYCQGVSDISGGIRVPDNMWHLFTCENQKRLNERMPHILRIPGKRGVLIEPMLEAVNIHKATDGALSSNLRYWVTDHIGGDKQRNIEGNYGIHQVILGPENAAGKRPFDPAWAESVKAQCEAAGVPFYRKDTGEGTLAWRI